MQGIGSVDFYVDLTQLSGLRIELTTLLAGLEQLDGCIAVDGHAMGGDEVADAVNRFVGRWAGGRQRIGEHLRSCLELVDLALEGYSGTEWGLQNAVSGGAS